MLRGGPGPSTNGAGTARRQRESKQCERESERERERREQRRRRVQKEAKTRRHNSSEKNVVMVLNKLWRGLGREKRLAAQRLGGKADDVFGAFGYQEVELDSL